MLIFEERGKLNRPEYPEKNLLEQRREPTTNSTHIWQRVWDTLVGGERSHHCTMHPCTPARDMSIDTCQNKLTTDLYHIIIMGSSLDNIKVTGVLIQLLMKYWFLIGHRGVMSGYFVVHVIRAGIISNYTSAVWACSKSKQKAKQYKQKTSPQSYKTEIKISA